MREIKFRAWDKEKQKMVFNAIEYETRCLSRMVGDENWHSSIGFFPEMDGQIFELMQFTGLFDKNGKEIYEGDLVLLQGWPYPHEVVYEAGNGRYVLIRKGRVWGSLAGSFPRNNPIVIGNIYENPDLLH